MLDWDTTCVIANPPELTPRPPPGRLELFFERTDFQLHRPSAPVLMREMPVGLCDGVRLEKVAVLQARLQSPRSRDIDAAVHIDPSHVDTLGTEIASERLCQAPHRELRRPERAATGVVEQHVRRTEPLADRTKHAGDLVAIADIARNLESGAAGRADLIPERLDEALVPS